MSAQVSYSETSTGSDSDSSTQQSDASTQMSTPPRVSAAQRRRGHYRYRTRARLSAQLAKRHERAPYGAKLGQHWDPVLKKNVPYVKDYFSGAPRPLRMKDNMYDNMSKQKLSEHREMHRRMVDSLGGGAGDGEETSSEEETEEVEEMEVVEPEDEQDSAREGGPGETAGKEEPSSPTGAALGKRKR